MAENWLQELKVGDDVVVESHGYRSEPRYIATINRVLKTQLQLKNGDKFTRSSGTKVGAYGFHKPYLRQLIPGDKEHIREEHKRRIFVRKIESAKWEQITTDKLKRIIAILEEKE
jgi:hypothetical protein